MVYRILIVCHILVVYRNRTVDITLGVYIVLYINCTRADTPYAFQFSVDILSFPVHIRLLLDYNFPWSKRFVLVSTCTLGLLHLGIRVFLSKVSNLVARGHPIVLVILMAMNQLV